MALPLLPLQPLIAVEVAGAGPAEGPAPHFVLPPGPVQAVLAAVARPPAARAPVSLQGESGAAVADLAVRQEPHQSLPLRVEVPLKEPLTNAVTRRLPAAGDDELGAVCVHQPE